MRPLLASTHRHDEEAPVPTPEEMNAEFRCPVCGRAGLADIAFDAEPAEATEGGPPRPAQTADSHQVLTYACGHQIPGPSLAGADANTLEVERRSSEDTTDSPPDA